MFIQLWSERIENTQMYLLLHRLSLHPTPLKLQTAIQSLWSQEQLCQTCSSLKTFIILVLLRPAKLVNKAKACFDNTAPEKVEINHPKSVKNESDEAARIDIVPEADSRDDQIELRAE